MKNPIAAVAVLALALSAAPGASAGTSPAPVIESFAVAGTGIQRIRVTIPVDAPVDRVRSVMFDYARYPEFMPMYKKATVISTTPAGGRLVQTQIGGVISLWMRFEISPPATTAGVERYEGRLVKGNVKAFRPRWELEPRGDRTRVTVESFLDPDLPLVPDGLVNSGARDGMRDAIVALKARVEGRPAPR